MSTRDADGPWRRLRSELRRKPRHALALGILLPLLLVAWMPILRGGEASGASMQVAAPALVSLAPPATRRADLGAVTRLRPRVAAWLEPQRSAAANPRRDPFAIREAEVGGAVTSPSTATPPTALASEPEREAALAAQQVLGATFLSPGHPAAARIDGRLVRVGEPFGVFALEEVGPRWVSLRGRHGRYRLEMTPAGGG